MDDTENRLEQCKPGGYREVIRVAWPLVVSTGSFTAMMFCDRMFLAWHDAVAIQAALPAGILSFTLICGFMALAAYAGTFVAQFHGAGEPTGCSRATAQGVFVSLLSIPALLLLIPIGEWLLRISGHDVDVLAAELIYFRILMLGAFATPLNAAIASFFTGRGHTRITMMANVVGNAFNICLDYALIFGKWGFPALGIKGAALATVISGFISPLILFSIFFSRGVNREFNTLRLFRLDVPLLRRLIRFGYPSGVHLFLDVASFSFFVLLTGRLGAVSLSASNIALSINTLAFMPLIGIGIAAQILVGQYQGREQPEVAERVGWSALKLGLGYMLVVGSSFVILPEFYFSLFAGRSAAGVSLEEILPLGRILLVVMACWGLVDTVPHIIGGALKGAGDTRFVMIFSLVMAWLVFASGQYVIIEVINADIVVSWIWTAFYITLLSVGYFWRFRKGRWKQIDVLGRQATVVPARLGAEALVAAE